MPLSASTGGGAGPAPAARRRPRGALKSPWADGPRHLLFEPLTLLEKLAALIPRPQTSLVVYHGVLAPHSGWRARVGGLWHAAGGRKPCSEASDTSNSAPRHSAWAARLCWRSATSIASRSAASWSPRPAAPALSAVLSRAAGVVAELGGSTSHLAALARERGIPAVLGARGATRRIPEGATVAVDGITGVVRWAR